jgi:hypothetical protein
MSKKQKLAGVALLASMAMGAFAALDAPAKTGGHFVSSEGHTVLRLSVLPPVDALRIKMDGEASEIECGVVQGSGTLTASTASEVELTTENSECRTPGTEAGWTLDRNECVLRLKAASGEPATTEQTSELACPEGKALSSTHQNCTFTIPSQKSLGGLTYTRIFVDGKHAITMDVNITYAAQYHGGICVFLGTNHTATFTGSTILKGLNTSNEPIAITAT